MMFWLGLGVGLAIGLVILLCVSVPRPLALRPHTCRCWVRGCNCLRDGKPTEECLGYMSRAAHGPRGRP